MGLSILNCYLNSVIECPGGAEFPCNNNGVCHNGINGTGVCLCKSGFNGTSCEYRNVNGTLQAWSKYVYYGNIGMLMAPFKLGVSMFTMEI